MQKIQAQTNAQRSAQTRRALVVAARSLFVEKGFASTTTPELVERAGLTRGALYHHFRDKGEVLHSVLEEEAREVAEEIEKAAPTNASPVDALRGGSVAYLNAMAFPGRTRLLLIEGPAALGAARMAAIDEGHAAASLRAGLEEAMPGHHVAALTNLLSASFDRAALDIEGGGEKDAIRAAMLFLIDRVVTSPS
ncbi:TetR/AcrR family transcriptional regulator [Arthrobacter sp. PAMC 25486]|uniref:TetR/AcrR family transcriptional regulator n=1 Tax=Arthrobacter sp. PAMC 25486 TaxID=1494608 RepID=UPI00057037F0|nr:TetR/AcrR family transcriptional regulator [Arthrobacter sp. PAMC 25486]